MCIQFAANLVVFQEQSKCPCIQKFMHGPGNKVEYHKTSRQSCFVVLVHLSVTVIKMTHPLVPHVHYHGCDCACVSDTHTNCEQGRLIVFCPAQHEKAQLSFNVGFLSLGFCIKIIAQSVMHLKKYSM